MIIFYDDIDKLPILHVHQVTLIIVLLEGALILNHIPAGAAELEETLPLLQKLLLIWH